MLDPFCGCATTLLAANRLDRQWVGIDLSPKAGELVVDRIKDSEGLFGDIQVREDIPKRTDLGPPLTTQERREYKGVLYGLQVGRCNGCNIHFELARGFHMDHIVARARGGTDHDFNFQTAMRPLQQRQRQEDTSRVRRDYQPKEERLFVDVVPQAADRVGALYYR